MTGQRSVQAVASQRRFWDSLYLTDHAGDTFELLEREWRWFAAHALQEGARTAIDVGCGRGALSGALALHGKLQTIGYDWSTAAVAVARGSLSHPLLSFANHDFGMPVRPAGVQPGSVDVVCCRFVLQYLDLPEFIAHARCLLRPGTGTVYVVTQVREQMAKHARGGEGLPRSVIAELRDVWPAAPVWPLTPGGEVVALALCGARRAGSR
ncbi:class I SAM-dependent methyltransferase [Streptomyces sp. NPDC056056]|uniref:class I SAM-dependent methyltransferase n=1 Tax=Streptomyces sp. NPDC056056 TaxID=3345698 RepID=UPI0035D736F5